MKIVETVSTVNLNELIKALTPHLDATYQKKEESGVFVFDTNEWGITEGVVTNNLAINNTNQINQAIQFAVNNGFKVFEIDNVNTPL